MYNNIIGINSEFVVKQTISVGIDSQPAPRLRRTGKSVRINQPSNNSTGFDPIPTNVS